MGIFGLGRIGSAVAKTNKEISAIRNIQWICLAHISTLTFAIVSLSLSRATYPWSFCFWNVHTQTEVHINWDKRSSTQESPDNICSLSS
jgi:hypothetical protein